MKKNLAFAAATAALLLTLGFTMNNHNADSGLREILLNQLKSTHNKADWFVPANAAVEGLTADQAIWKDKGNHSVAQLTGHIIFWNEQQLAKFKGEKPAAFSGNNEETFEKVTKESWEEAVKRLDKVMVGLENAVQNATEAQLKEWAPNIANISTHNAYHTGQIIVVRKQQGSWNPEKGVK